MMGCPQIGGCDFPVDPDLPAPDASIFWRPEIAPAVVTLVAATSELSLQSVRLADKIAERRTDGRGLSWVRLHDGAIVVGTDADIESDSLSVVIPIDDDWAVRVAAAHRLRTQLIGNTADPPLTRQRRERLKRALRTIDGRREGASYRTIASAFFGSRRVSQEPWKTSSLKAQIARLAMHGRMLIKDGYRMLLNGNSGRSVARRDR